MEPQPESEERLRLNGRMFEQPGTSQPKRERPRAKASDGRWRGMEQPSMRAERKKEEREAEAKHKMTPEEQLALYRRMVTSGELARQAPDRKRQRMVDDRPGVWQLGSWVNGDKPCPDEFVTWDED
jgi:hypothetical protein